MSMEHPRFVPGNAFSIDRTRQAQRGFGLVELMVAMVIGLIIIAGVISIFVSNQQTFASNESLARIQENSRISFELMAREIRQAGGNVCGARAYGNITSAANPASGSPAWYADWAGGTVVGYGGNTVPPDLTVGTAATNMKSGTDAIKVLSGNEGDSFTVASHDKDSAVLTLTSDTGPAEGDLIMVCDGTAATLAVANAAGKVSGKATVSHGKLDSDSSEVNCAPGLGYPTSCTTSNDKTIAAGGKVTKLVSAIWYVGYNSRGGTSLFRMNASGTKEEIAEGVTDLQLTYLLRDESESPPTLEADWLSADTPAGGSTIVDDFSEDADKQVVAVRIKMKLQGADSNGAPMIRDLIYVANLRNKSI